MKAFTLILFCVVAAAQGRSTAIETAAAKAVVERPWVVHLRVAVGTSGLLNSCTGSLIDERWVLTSASCVHNARFIWVRFNAPNVFQPELVLEVSEWTAAGRTFIQRQSDFENYANDIAVIKLAEPFIPRYTERPIIAIIPEVSSLPSAGAVCGYGEEDDTGAPGENLECYDVDVIAVSDGGTLIGHSDVGEATEFDLGAPLAADGVLFGVLSKLQGNEATFTNPAFYREWIRATTGVDL